MASVTEVVDELKQIPAFAADKFGVRAQFALALKAEREGNMEKAHKHLDAAVAAEVEGKE